MSAASEAPETRPSGTADGFDAVLVPADRLRAAVHRIFCGAGSSEREAHLIAEHLVEANLRGHDSHGVGVVPAYVRNARGGEMVLNQTLGVALDTGPLLVCEGRSGVGQVMAHDAMALGIARARAHGSCLVLLRDSHHVGRIGHWAEQCAGSELVSVHFVNVVSDPAVAPFGGTAARLGTNPFAVGIPRPAGAPLVVDFATSRWAVGKVRVALNAGGRVPEGTLVDPEGRPTIDPAALFASPPGALLPFGEHKGFGLALACELLAGALSGGRTQAGPRTGAAVLNSMMSLIVSPAHLGTTESFAQQVEAVVRWVLSENETGPGAVRLPGDPEREWRERRLREGVPIDRATVQQIRAAAEEVGVSLTPGLE